MKTIKTVLLAFSAIVAFALVPLESSANTYTDTYTSNGNFGVSVVYSPSMGRYDYLAITTRVTAYDSNGNEVAHFRHEAELGPWVNHSHSIDASENVVWDDNLNYDQGWMSATLQLPAGQQYTIVVEVDDGSRGDYLWDSDSTWDTHSLSHYTWNTQGSVFFDAYPTD